MYIHIQFQVVDEDGVIRCGSASVITSQYDKHKYETIRDSHVLRVWEQLSICEMMTGHVAYSILRREALFSMTLPSTPFPRLIREIPGSRGQSSRSKSQ